MAIKINQTDPVRIRLTFKSLQAIGYVINIENAQGKNIEKFIGDNKNNNWKDIELISLPAKLIGNYIQGYFSIADPSGKGNNILVTIEVFQNGVSVYSKDVTGKSTEEIVRKTFRELFKN